LHYLYITGVIDFVVVLDAGDRVSIPTDAA